VYSQIELHLEICTSRTRIRSDVYLEKRRFSFVVIGKSLFEGYKGAFERFDLDPGG